jgi:quercetin dioxygenase-like cupin family protein
LDVLEIATGDLRGLRYRFDIGEGLPMHEHDESTAHITIVASGSIRVHGPAIEPEIIKAGEAIDFEVDSPHEIMAEENDTIIFNIVKRKGGA